MPPRRRPQIDRADAVNSALELIDREGLQSFSIEKLGRHLNVRGPSLYHHFTDRADLLARVAQQILLEVVEPESDGDDPGWKEWMTYMGLGLRRALLRHPNAGPLMLEHFPHQLMLPTYERTAVLLAAEGIPDELQLAIFEGVEKLTLGSALYEAMAQSASGIAFPDLDRSDAPVLSRAIATSVDRTPEALYLTALEALLDGLEVQISAQR